MIWDIRILQCGKSVFAGLKQEGRVFVRGAEKAKVEKGRGAWRARGKREITLALYD